MGAFVTHTELAAARRSAEDMHERTGDRIGTLEGAQGDDHDRLIAVTGKDAVRWTCAESKTMGQRNETRIGTLEDKVGKLTLRVVAAGGVGGVSAGAIALAILKIWS